MKNKKILFISSTGGHLSEMLKLKPMFKKYDYHIITEKDKSTVKLKEEYNDKIDYLVYGTKDKLFTYFFKFIFNSFKSLYYLIKIKPNYIITTGAHTAVPICILSKLFNIKIIYIETIANSETKTLTGKILYPFVNLFIVQHKSMLKLYKKAVYGGWIY